jgi:OOP family OmpA-OmpF porin
MRYVLCSLLSLVTLAACDTTASLAELQQTPPPENAYARALMAAYQSLAEEELERYDWWSSQYFADKGLVAAEGKPVTPEDPALRSLTPQVEEMLSDARIKLAAAITPEATRQWPQVSARAMASYDCWVENSEEGWTLNSITRCRMDFEQALARLTQGRIITDMTAEITPVLSPPPAPAPVPAPVQAAPPAPAPAPVVKPTSSIFYFPFDEYRLMGESLELLQRFITGIRAAGPAEIIINGHADRAGSEEYNLALSERRARFVLDELLAAGIDPSAISYYAFGETDPRVATEDGVAEQANRRVEIFIE